MRSQGEFSDIPFAYLLHQLWRSRSTGLLTIDKEQDIKLSFLDGQVAVQSRDIDRDRFFSYLENKGEISGDGAPVRLKIPSDFKTSLIRYLIERQSVRPDRLWIEIKKYVMEEISSLFDLDRGSYRFHKDKPPEMLGILIKIPTDEIILYGCRKMTNFKIIRSFLSDDTSFQVFLPDHSGHDQLQPEEQYVFQYLKSQADPALIYDRSELGEKETQRILFLLMCLGYIGKEKTSPQIRSYKKASPDDLDKILFDLNEKISFIFRYMSKEIGLVSQKVLEKSMDDIRENLSPVFKDIHLDKNGRFDSRKVLEKTSRSGKPGIDDEILKDINEILAAEILAIKTTLGDDHESVLVESLSKLGE